MEKFNKITVGFVTQVYTKDKSGIFICAEQNFTAGDQVSYEAIDGSPIVPPIHKYQPFNMTLEGEV